MNLFIQDQQINSLKCYAVLTLKLSDEFLLLFKKNQQPLLLILITFLCSFSHSVLAEKVTVVTTDNLQKILDSSQDGDILTLSSGLYLGNFIITKQITLRGEKGATIDAQGSGHALTLKNSYITVSNLSIINWGDDLTEQNSGIYSNDKINNERAVGLVIENNTLSGDGFGIWLNHVTKAKVFNNKVEGNLTLRSADRGNGIQVANVTHSHVFKNETYKTRDGIYVISSQNNLIEANTMHDLRYGIHYMYSYDNTVKDNTAYSTRAGYALMSSRRLTITGNKTSDSEDYGFLLNFITQSTFTNNHVKNVWTKPENKVLGRDGKGLFVYNSGYNTLEKNIIDTAEIGIHLTAGSENIKIYGNSFINNPIQVKYVSNKKQEWSKDGRGNYWSNYLGWDMNNDGIGDAIFEPNDGIDKLVWQYPEMKMIMDSPAILILRWVQKQFPVLKAPGVKDSHPLMTPHFSQYNASEQHVSLPKTESLQEEQL
jgi:nitrous oxidase accessory protein